MKLIRLERKAIALSAFNMFITLNVLGIYDGYIDIFECDMYVKRLRDETSRS